MRGLRGFVGGVVSICSNTYLTMGGSSSHPREAGAGSSMTVPTVSQRCWHPLEGGGERAFTPVGGLDTMRGRLYPQLLA